MKATLETANKLAAEPNALAAYDQELRRTAPILCGVDEAGRGPLCGPVSIGAVVLDPEKPIPGLNDSKKLSEKKREALYDLILDKALAYKIVFVSPADIDRMNILQATLFGMKQAVEELPVVPDLVLVDGNQLPNIQLECKAVTKGDATSESIAAASILAKVARDRYMAYLDKEYPEYKLAQHKGYPTKLHYELLDTYGIQQFYRQSFLKKWKAGK